MLTGPPSFTPTKQRSSLFRLYRLNRNPNKSWIEKIHPSQQWRPYEDSSFGSLHNRSLSVTASSSSSTAVYSAHHHPSSTADDLIVGRREWESNQGLKASSLRKE